MNRPVLSEADLSKKVVSWLESEGWTVYQEVSIFDKSNYGARADIVAVRDSIVWVIECKLTLSFEVIAQAERWLGYAHMVSVAVPEAKASLGRSAAIRAATALGIGMVNVKRLWPIEDDRICPVVIRSALPHRPHINPALLDSLREGHKTHALAGGNRGGQYTRFKETLGELRAFAEKHPGCTLRSALQTIPHHYSSVSSGVAAIQKLASKGLLKGGLAVRFAGPDERGARLYVAVDGDAPGETPLEAKKRRRAVRAAALKAQGAA